MAKVAKPRKHGDGWQINWKDGTGARRFKTHPTHRAAQAALARNNAEAQAVRRGDQELLPEKTWEDLETHFKIAKAGKRSLKEDESRMRLHLRPAFGGLRLTEVTDVRVARFRAGLLQRVKRKQLAVGTVRLILALLKSMLNVAVEARWLVRRPAVKLPPAEDKPYIWLKSEEDMAAFLAEAAKVSRGVGVMQLYATALYAGLRAGELAGLEWDDIDFDTRLITVQRSRTTPTKANKVRWVPIMTPLLAVLEAWQAEDVHRRLVFPNEAGQMQGKTAKVFKDAFHRCRERAGLPRMTFHDLRHTFASHWMLRGGDIFKLQKVLGHASVVTTQRYAHLAPEAFRADWDRFGDFASGAMDVRG